jgi:hypothetical protein
VNFSTVKHLGVGFGLGFDLLKVVFHTHV